MSDLSKVEKIAKLGALINEGKNLHITKSIEQPNYSLDPFDERTSTIQYYPDVNHDAYPGWRINSLVTLRNFFGKDSTYVKEFEENCQPNSTEYNLRQGIGVLEAAKKGYEDGIITEEVQLTDKSDNNYPERYWHCAIKVLNQKKYAVVNDLSFDEIQKRIIQPWLNSNPFTVDGKIVNRRDVLEEIKIAQTPEPIDYYRKVHNEKMKQANVFDVATDRRMLPLEEGKDYTQELLFASTIKQNIQLEDPSINIIERVCQRIGKSANLLKTRTRAGKSGYIVEDEYDVQDLLQATLRAFIQHSVQEDPLPKIAGNSSRADITIEELGLIIEIKYVRSPNDQKKLVEDFAKDIMYYSKWEHLREFFCLIYNSADLRDPEELESLNGLKDVNGRKFNSKVILA